MELIWLHLFLYFLQGGLVINPPPKTIYQQRLHQLSEAGYSTNQKAPLGRSHDQSPGLPNCLDIGNATFGVKSPKSESDNKERP